jgi:hypothetical protein
VTDAESSQDGGVSEGENRPAGGLSRSQFLARASTLGLLASAGGLGALGGLPDDSEARRRKRRGVRARASTNPALKHRGVNYDVGTAYEYGGVLSREYWSTALMRSEIRKIKYDLNCNAVNVFGSDIPRMVATATYALQKGLKVWLQPRLIDSTLAQQLTHLETLAREAETLRATYTGWKVLLDVGCELSIFSAGIIPGDTFLERVEELLRTLDRLPDYNDRLNDHLGDAITTASAYFRGRLTYGSGIWEGVDWASFDLIGLNYYRDRYNETTYEDDLRAFFAWGKPVVITEFGCCTFSGADDYGADGDSIVDWTANPPEILSGFTRSERTQADYLEDLLDVYETLGCYGVFAFEYIEPPYPHDPRTPRYDLDMASFGLVKPVRVRPLDSASEYTATAKASFTSLAARYGLY